MSTNAWRELIPHQGKMRLLDTVLSFDATRIRMSTATHRDPENPLRSESGLRAIHLCEYGAQAMAVHGALLAQASGGLAAHGLLVSLREVQLTRDWIDDLPDDLIVIAECLHASDSTKQYRFEITHDGELLAQGRAAVISS